MKKLLLACTYFVVSVCTSNALALTYKEITNLENPFDTDEEFEDEYSREAIRMQAEYDRFHSCQEVVAQSIIFSKEKRIIISAGEKLNEYSTKKGWARYIGLEYPYVSSQNDGLDLVARLAVEIGWDMPSNNQKEIDVLANTYWNKCIGLPIDDFEKRFREDAGD